MSAGGVRENSGRRSVWASQPSASETQTIRVPTAIASQIIDFAEELDRQTVNGKVNMTVQGKISWVAWLKEWQMARDDLIAMSEKLGLPKAELTRSQGAKLFNAMAKEAASRRDSLGSDSSGQAEMMEVGNA